MVDEYRSVVRNQYVVELLRGLSFVPVFLLAVVLVGGTGGLVAGAVAALVVALAWHAAVLEARTVYGLRTDAAPEAVRAEWTGVDTPLLALARTAESVAIDRTDDAADATTLVLTRKRRLFGDQVTEVTIAERDDGTIRTTRTRNGVLDTDVTTEIREGTAGTGEGTRVTVTGRTRLSPYSYLHRTVAERTAGVYEAAGYEVVESGTALSLARPW